MTQKMNYFRTQLCLILVCVSLSMSLSVSLSAKAETIDGVVAKVGNKVITRSDVQEALAQQKVMATTGTKDQKSREAYQKFKGNVLEELILQKVLLSEMDRNDIQVSSYEVDQTVESRRKSAGLTENEFITQMSREGLSLSSFREMIEFDLRKQQFIQQKIMPKLDMDEQKLIAEYRKSQKDFTDYRSVRFTEVTLPYASFTTRQEADEMAQTIYQKLSKNVDVSDLIKKYSAGAYAPKGGDSGIVSKSDLRLDIKNVLDQLKVGEVTRPIQTAQAIFLFKLVAQSEPFTKPFSEVAPLIRNRYYDTIIQDELRKYLMIAKEDTYIEILENSWPAKK